MSVKKRIAHLEKLTDEQFSKKDFDQYVVQYISFPQEYYEYEGKRVTFEEYQRLISAQYESQNKGVIFVVRHTDPIHPDNIKPEQNLSL